MFCPKCGNQIPEGSGFCPKCGARIEAAAAPAAQPGDAPQPATSPVPAPKPRNRALVIGIAAAAAVVLVLIIIGLVNCSGGAKVDANGAVTPAAVQSAKTLKALESQMTKAGYEQSDDYGSGTGYDESYEFSRETDSVTDTVQVELSDDRIVGFSTYVPCDPKVVSDPYSYVKRYIDTSKVTGFTRDGEFAGAVAVGKIGGKDAIIIVSYDSSSPATMEVDASTLDLARETIGSIIDTDTDSMDADSFYDAIVAYQEASGYEKIR